MASKNDLRRQFMRQGKIKDARMNRYQHGTSLGHMTSSATKALRKFIGRKE